MADDFVISSTTGTGAKRHFYFPGIGGVTRRFGGYAGHFQREPRVAVTTYASGTKKHAI